MIEVVVSSVCAHAMGHSENHCLCPVVYLFRFSFNERSLTTLHLASPHAIIDVM